MCAASRTRRTTGLCESRHLYLVLVSDSGQGRDNAVQSVDRAVSILQVVGRQGVIGVTEIANELSVHKSTVSRLLGTLEARGLVEQTANRGRYRLGQGIAQLAEGVTRKHDLSLISREVSTSLAEDVGETVNVVVVSGDHVVTIDQVIGSASITTVNWVGKRQPVHATASGKVFLAHMSADERTELLASRLEQLTPDTIVNRRLLDQELDAVREQGFASAMEEQEVGLVAVAAPIRSMDGTIIAALVVSGPTFRLDPDAIPAVAERLVAAAALISERNGHPRAG